MQNKLKFDYGEQPFKISFQKVIEYPVEGQELGPTREQVGTRQDGESKQYLSGSGPTNEQDDSIEN